VDLTRTRLALHGAAELLLAGPQYAVSNTVRLRVVPGGIATVAEPDLRIEGTELVGAWGRQPLRGSYAEVAAAAGLKPRRLDDVYHDGVDVSVDDLIELDPDHVATLLDGFAAGDAALRAFTPDQVPVLWPEHFDVGISHIPGSGCRLVVAGDRGRVGGSPSTVNREVGGHGGRHRHRGPTSRRGRWPGVLRRAS
jgi:hypothetical protein